MAEGSGAPSAPLVEPTLAPKIKMRQFLVLMWKHLTVRKSRFIATPFELLSPCFFFILLALLRNQINPETPFNRMNLTELRKSMIRHTETVPLANTLSPKLILYSPDSPPADAIMNDVGERLNVKRLTTFPIWSSRGYFAFSNDTITNINDFLKAMSDNSAVVMFQDMEVGPWPRKLNYTIRMKSDFKTQIYQSLDYEAGGYHERFGTIYEPFMRLQWAIDCSYLSILSGENIDKPLSFQEFPSSSRIGISNVSIVTMVLRYACVYSLLLPFVFLLTRLLEERATGVQELIRMVGVSNSTLAYSHLVNVVPTALFYSICGAIVVKVTANPYIPNSDGFLIFLMLLLHFSSIMALAFICSYLTKTAQYATTMSVICFVITWMPARVLENMSMHRLLLLFSGFLPHVPMNWFWYEVEKLEGAGGSVDYFSMWTSHTNSSGSVALALFIMLVQTVVFFNLAWYLSMVVPGKYGVGLPWSFIFQRSYWFKKKVDPGTPLDDGEDEPIPTKDPRFFEDPYANENVQHDVGIKIANVYKTYGKDTALNNVSLDVFKGEITVLLGHNGAGKTTLMSIITGMTSASAGAVYVNGSDMSRDRGELRRQLGLCPQHNLFFPDLSVLEHLIFFAMLKGSSYTDARKSSMDLLTRLGIEDKAYNRSDELSGGMKRRLQLACALAGGASVLILDEPTSGLDVETRRELWDLLLSLRGDRTVLLTTHFMEEADALGDRVAALHKGRLRCHATPMYLKKNIGTGYRLSLTTIGLPKDEAITSLIASVLPGATVKESSYNSISYNLPAQQSNRFPQLFAALETNRSQLGIDSIGVGVSSLEEVFLKLCSDVDTKFTQETVDSSVQEPTYKRMYGIPLYARQMWVLLHRQMRYILFKKGSFFILQVFLPLLAIFFFTYVLNDAVDEDKNRNKLTTLDLDMYNGIVNKKALYSVEHDYKEAVDKLAESYKDVTFERSDDIAETMLQLAQDDDLTEYNKYLVGMAINSTDAKILYTTTVRHTAPVALNLLSNILAIKLLPWANGRTITVNNHPLEGSYVRFYDHQMKEPKDLYACLTWTILVVSIIAGALINAVTLPIKEKLSGTRHIHVMSGCPPAVLWLATLLFHTVLYTVLLVLPTAAITLIDKQMTLNQPTYVGSLILILTLGSAAFLAFCYLISFSFTERGAGLFLTAVIIILGLVPGLAERTGDMLGHWRFPVMLCNYLFPTATMTSALSRAASVARLNAFCYLNLEKCPNIIPTLDIDVKECCAQQKGTVCILCMEGEAPGKQLIILAVQLVIYTALVVVTQYGLFNSLFDRLVNFNYRPGMTRFNDEMVRAEKTYVNKGIQLPPKQIADAMLVNDVHKNYFRCLKPRSPCNAVKGVSFSVKKGECFGLLGVNGAGKSTTFKMITGEECPTRGGVFANGHHLKWPRSQYLQSLGYCPQFFGLDEFLTGQENLSLLLTLRGLEEQDVKAETSAWIEVVGLERYRNTLVEGYSGGCMRRLATAAALSSGAPVTLLDEPTSGVDVSARRRVWVALRKGLRQHRAVIITSHSMDEMEALCDRIAIMSGGELGALGSACALRAAHAAGHALVLKLGAHYTHQHGDVVDSAKPAVNSLKESLKQKFNCSLKDEHKTMLHYHINETMRYSELFSALEQLKEEFPHLIEDYSVTETTLEEVFLSFAQPSNPDEPNSAEPTPAHPVLTNQHSANNPV